MRGHSKSKIIIGTLISLCLLPAAVVKGAAPSNDACADAICLEDGAVVNGTTVEATGTGLESTCTFLGDPNDVWYSYTPTVSEVVTFALCASEFDTTLAVYDGCGGAELGCNDDSDVCEEFSLQSSLSVGLLGGNTYRVRVAGSEGIWGDFILTVSGGAGNCTGAVCDPPLKSDTNNDCIINLEDFAEMAKEWLQCHLQPADGCP